MNGSGKIVGCGERRLIQYKIKKSVLDHKGILLVAFRVRYVRRSTDMAGEVEAFLSTNFGEARWAMSCGPSHTQLSLRGEETSQFFLHRNVSQTQRGPEETQRVNFKLTCG